ncbi:DUF6159 family protein [Amycolatopsis umgeniensis]|uniref:Uncharacterized protein n=1 Tax=Amycolatopsis umgeniensis TaxID=336628 RepID=A0A841AX60_9PSEU|nr:hypothetical protein [Amycolatopsis umgeniensis]
MFFNAALISQADVALRGDDPRVSAGLAGAAWNLITYLVLPVMMIEDAGVRHEAKRSAELLNRTWGEQAAGRFGIGLVGILLTLAGFAVFMGAGFLLGGTITIVVSIGISLVWGFLVSVLCTTPAGIYQTALYRYAADGIVPEAFGKVEFEGAFATR